MCKPRLYGHLSDISDLCGLAHFPTQASRFLYLRRRLHRGTLVARCSNDSNKEGTPLYVGVPLARQFIVGLRFCRRAWNMMRSRLNIVHERTSGVCQARGARVCDPPLELTAR